MSIGRGRLAAIMALVVAVLSLYAALQGLLNREVYEELLRAGSLTKPLLVGSLAQDIITIPLGIVLAILSVVFITKPNLKCLIAVVGLTGYFFYGYGLYVIQGQYTSLYLVYLAIFGISIYSIILGLLGLAPLSTQTYRLSPALRLAIVIFLLLILVILIPSWLIRLSSGIANHRPEGAYAVLILDLSLVFPAIAITASKLLKRHTFGILLAGVMLIKVFTVCLSWGFSQWFVQFYGFELDYTLLTISSGLTVISLVLLVLYMYHLRGE